MAWAPVAHLAHAQLRDRAQAALRRDSKEKDLLDSWTRGFDEGW